MVTTEENKLSEQNKEESLASLFQKYRIDQYFSRNYKDIARHKTRVAIFSVFIVSILSAILFCYLVLPS